MRASILRSLPRGRNRAVEDHVQRLANLAARPDRESLPQPMGEAHIDRVGIFGSPLAVQSRHQKGDSVLPERVLPDVAQKARDHSATATGRDRQGEVLFGRAGPLLLQRRRVRGETRYDEAVVHAAAPQRQRAYRPRLDSARPSAFAESASA
jgi:hypothetical protein